MKRVKSWPGTQYQPFLVKWLTKPATESTFVAEDELQQIDPKIYAEVRFALDVGLFSRGGE